MNNLHEDRMRDQEWGERQDRIAQWKEEAMSKTTTTTTQTVEQARHTPGPWKHEYAGLIYANCHRNSPVAKASQADLHGRSQAEALANARLIAAAPELLEACRAAMKAVDLALCGTPSQHYFTDLKARLKATGYTLEDNLALNMKDIKNASNKAHAQLKAAIARAEGGVS